VLLNGWKEIAVYLRSGVRTVQRWESLGMPVMRVRPGDRGAVMARTESLDNWLRGRALELEGHLHHEIVATVSRATELREKTSDELRVLLENELRLGISMADLASRSKDANRAARLTGMATQAYNPFLRLSERSGVSRMQTKQFVKDLGRLKVVLQKLGEDV